MPPHINLPTHPNGAEALPEAELDRWQLLRAGLQNIWEYDDQRFVFHRGRLLLRGRNESGKSKALEVLLPFLLDADLTPQRLDPFGSSSRPMHWNLLNEGNPEESMRIGYVWLEFGRCGPEGRQYCTIGAGLRAKRPDKEVDAWYFVTSQRVDADLHLFDKARVPLSRKQLVDAIGVQGTVPSRSSDYRRLVNQRLFSMPDEQYCALINTLLQLRRPQLSKVLKPDELSTFLTASLPPLQMDVISRLAEGFGRLDRDRAKRDEFAQTFRAVCEFIELYRRYVRIVAKSRAQEMTRADSAYQRARGQMRQAGSAYEEAVKKQAACSQAIKMLEAQEAALEGRIQGLRTSKEFQAISALDDAETLAKTHATQEKIAQANFDKERRDEAAHRDRLVAGELAKNQQANKLADARAAALVAARDAALAAQHDLLDPQVESGNVEAAWGILETVIEGRKRAIDALQEAAQHMSRAKHAEESAALQHQAASERAADAQLALEADQREEEAASGGFVERVRAWVGTLVELKLGGLAPGQTGQPGEHAELVELMRAPLDAMQPMVERAAAEVRAALDEEAAKLRDALAVVQRKMDSAQIERDALAAATHQPPPAPAWRPGRPSDRSGAPLYLLCDFREQDPVIQAGVEAALEASGLLDAWVTPEGEVLDRDRLMADVIFAPGIRQAGTSAPVLADVLEPTEAGGVTRAVIEHVLKTVGLSRDGRPVPDKAAWVATDGRFRMGPLVGAWRKERAAFIGQTARERARERRLAELDQELAAHREEAQALEAGSAGVRSRKASLAQELERFPSLEPVVAARTRVEMAEKHLGKERVAEAGARQAHERAQAVFARAQEACHAKASDLGLRGWIDALPELREAMYMYRVTAQHLLHEARALAAACIAYEERLRAMDEAKERVREARAALEHAADEARRFSARAEALRQTVGKSREELMATLRQAEAEQSRARDDLSRERSALRRVDEEVGTTRSNLAAAEEQVRAATESRAAAEARFRELASTELLAVTEIELDVDSNAEDRGSPATWTLTDTLRVARLVDSATASMDASDDARDRAENKAALRYQELARSLPAEVRLQPQRVHGLTQYGATLSSRSMGLMELSRELEDIVTSRDRLLDAQERKLFESFLSGETHEHLRNRLRQANELVEHMNKQLKRCPTASGRELRLDWHVTKEAPRDTDQAISLLFRAGHLLSDANRQVLHDFLRERLDVARNEDGAGTLIERMMQVLDYRSWFEFTIQYRDLGAAAWQTLTRKAHGAGSGGQKAVMLHLPLFAAAAAFYASAVSTAPRLIVLDEAFAGIDPKIRGQLMGLLVALDLDFLMTSFEEWGFYQELDGLSTYHLQREQGMPGVYTDWFLWNGASAIEMGPR